jgi:hypothetical protein
MDLNDKVACQSISMDAGSKTMRDFERLALTKRRLDRGNFVLDMETGLCLLNKASGQALASHRQPDYYVCMTRPGFSRLRLSLAIP